MSSKKNNIIYSLYYKPIINNWVHQTNIYKWPWKKQRSKRSWHATLLKIPKLLLAAQKQTIIFSEFLSKWSQFAYVLNKNYQNIFFVVKNGWKYDFSIRKTIDTSWQRLKKIKQAHKLAKSSESRKLNWLKRFYRNFGFRKNKNRVDRALIRTKKFKKFRKYDQILQLARHKKKGHRSYDYPVQSCRTNGPSYYKVKQQLFCYWQRNYFSNNFTKKKLAIISDKFNNCKKKRLVKFISQVELTLGSFLLRTRLLRTRGIVHQFIKHGNVCINYNKILSPSCRIKPGDTVSIYVNSWKQRHHRFHDPLHAHRSMHGLYRKNTGRQSLIAYKKYPEFIKTSLNSVCTLNDTVSSLDKVIIHDILPFQAKDLINKTNNTSHIHFNNTSMANWKLSFLCNTMQGSFVQQNKYIDYINNNIA